MKESFLSYFKNQKLSKKMILIYIAIFGSFTIISMASHQVTLNIYDDQIYEKAVMELNYFAKAVEDELEAIERVSFRIATDYEMQRSLPVYLEGPVNKTFLENRAIVKAKLLSEALSSDSIISILYTSDSAESIGPMGDFYSLLSEEMTQELEQMARDANGACVNLNPSQDFPYIVSAREVKKHLDFSLDSLGMLTFVSDFNRIIDSNYRLLNNGNSELCIIYEDEVIYGEEDLPILNTVGQQSKHGYEIMNIDGVKMFVCYLEGGGSSWTFINMFPYSDIFYKNIVVRTAMMILFSILFLAAYFIIKRTSRFVTGPLEKLTDVMRQVEVGRFEEAKNQLIVENTRDEIGILEKNFKIMLDKIIVLIYENYEKQLILKETSYRMLQAQINPHFLYNTLSSIDWMILTSRNEEASEMIVSLGELLRAAVNKNMWASVHEELALLESYIEIQKVRYEDKAAFVIEIKGNVDDFLLPRMILQPIVENALQHVVDASDRHHEIRIQLYAKEEWLHITVKDDGPGIERHYLEQMNRFEMEPKGLGLGLKNIRQRLELLFDQDFEFYVESRAGRGTSVVIKVPKGGNDHVESSSY